MGFIELYVFSCNADSDPKTFIANAHPVIVPCREIKCAAPTIVDYIDDCEPVHHDGRACYIEFYNIPLLTTTYIGDTEIFIAETYESFKNRIANNIFVAPKPHPKDLYFDAPLNYK